ncbi:MAG TPA: nucleotidyltransferase family protein, partial [Acidimicrobiales bacterium]|nr:nucleotidyltransferase family protein [Acidimicrobiales bacterium]
SQRVEAGHLEADLTRHRIGYDHRVGPILECFDDADIDVRILKGVAIGRLDYPDEQLRPTSDLDLLVHAEQVDHAVQVLESLGGVRTDPDPTPGWTRRVGKGATVALEEWNLEVDLHRILVWGPLGVRVAGEVLWDRTRPFDYLGTERSTLALEETLLHVCAHLLILGVTRAREARDVAQLMVNPALDIERLLHVAQRWGHESVLAVGVATAVRELALTEPALPLVRWAQGHQVPRLDKVWLRAAQPEPRLHGLEQLGVLHELRHSDDPWGDRRILLRANLAPAPGTYPTPLRRLRSLAGRPLDRFRRRPFGPT